MSHGESVKMGMCRLLVLEWGVVFILAFSMNSASSDMTKAPSTKGGSVVHSKQ